MFAKTNMTYYNVVKRLKKSSLARNMVLLLQMLLFSVIQIARKLYHLHDAYVLCIYFVFLIPLAPFLSGRNDSSTA